MRKFANLTNGKSPVASISRRPDGQWRARYRDEAGREHARHFTRKVDGERWLRGQLTALDLGRWVDPAAGRITFLQFFETWSSRQIWADGTRKAMSLAVRSTTFGDLPLRQIRTSHVESWVKTMAGPGDRGRPLAVGTVKTRYTNVRSVFRAAVRDGVIARDPTEGVRLPRQRRREAALTIPTPEQVRSVLEAADDRFRAFVAVCAFAGLRLGEAAGLRTTDIDFLRRELQVRRQVQRVDGGGVDVRLPKYSSERTIPIPDRLLEILAAHVELPHRTEWLFAAGEESPPHQNTIGHRWRSTIARADVPPFRLHDLRHFFASGLIAAGCDVVTVQRALGHAKASTTLETYSHLWPSGADRTRRAAATLVDEVLGNSADYLRTSDPN